MCSLKSLPSRNCTIATVAHSTRLPVGAMPGSIQSISMEWVKRTIISSTSRSEPIVREIGMISVSDGMFGMTAPLPDLCVGAFASAKFPGQTVRQAAMEMATVDPRGSCPRAVVCRRPSMPRCDSVPVQPWRLQALRTVAPFPNFLQSSHLYLFPIELLGLLGYCVIFRKFETMPYPLRSVSSPHRDRYRSTQRSPSLLWMFRKNIWLLNEGNVDGLWFLRHTRSSFPEKEEKTYCN